MEQLLTIHNYDFFEVASAFQKAIRRGEEEDAMYWGIELYESNYRDYVWKRMIIMCSEDVGLGEPSCIVQVMALHESFEYLRKMKDYGGMKLPFTQAVICLVRSRKSRYCDHAITVYWHENTKQYRRREFKDYVFDKHTRRGKAMGRGLRHFYTDSCKICNANKLKGEEELERRAWQVDEVGSDIEREDIPVTDEGYMVARRRNDDSPTLF